MCSSTIDADRKLLITDIPEIYVPRFHDTQSFQYASPVAPEVRLPFHGAACFGEEQVRSHITIHNRYTMPD